MIDKEIIIKSKINTYNDFLKIFNNLKNSIEISFITKNYTNEELKQLRNWFYKAKKEHIKYIVDYSDSEIENITKYKLNNIFVKKYDIVRFYGINNFIESGIIKKANNKDEIYEIQTLDIKSLIYNGSYKIIEIIGKDKKFSFSNKNFHNFKKGQIFKLKFTKDFLQAYTNFYHNNFGQGIKEQLKDFQNIFKMNLKNTYDLEIFDYNGRYSYCCILNHIPTFNTFIIHEDLIKNHVIL